MKWKYKIKFTDKSTLKFIEERIGKSFPNELKNLIEKANAATPSANKIDVCGCERVVGGILSFNINDESDNVYDAIMVITNPVLIPFAIDPSGNYFCFDSEKNEVLFWNHEVNQYQELHLTIKEFVDELYE